MLDIATKPKPGQRLVSYEQALVRIQHVAELQRSRVDWYTSKTAQPASHNSVVSTRIAIQDAVGRTTLKKFVAPHSSPCDDTSAMDGFAICSAETANASVETPIMFRVVGVIAAGDSKSEWNTKVRESQQVCVEIMTGACFPEASLPHLDAVVKIEDVVMCDWSDDGNEVSRYIQVQKPVKAIAHRRPAGSDFRKGDLVVEAGILVQPKHVAALASLGFDSLVLGEDLTVAVEINQVHPETTKLRIGVLSTGSELCKSRSGTDDNSKQTIPDSNGPYAISFLRRWCPGAEVEYLGIAADNEDELTQSLTQALYGNYDVLLTSGGVSMGRFDLVRHVVETILGGHVVIHGVAIRPGAPVLFARLTSDSKEGSETRQTAFFGAPGNPIAAAATLHFFVLPYIEKLARGHSPDPRYLSLRNLSDEKTAVVVRKKPKDMTVFALAVEHPDTSVQILEDQASYKLSGQLQANCWVVLPAGACEVFSGDFLRTFPL